MKCPRCQRECSPTERCCTRCGLPLRREPSAFVKCFGGLFRGIGYVLFFFFMQYLVIAGFTSSEFSRLLMYYDTVPDTETLRKLIQMVAEYAVEKTIPLLLIAGILTILLLALIFRLRRRDFFT